MPEKITTEDLLGNIMETIADNIPRHRTGSSFFQEATQSDSVSSQINRLFGRQRSVHHVFGGGKTADVLLWRNKKISASVLTAATVTWILFEWLNYHFLTLVCFALVLGMLAQFVWSNASGLMNRSSARVPRLVLPDELFVNAARSVGAQVNQTLLYLQDISCGGNLKQFLMVVGSLWAAAVIGSWCNFLTVMYIGFVAAHTLPVLYERYEDEVDSFVNQVLGQFQHHYRKVDTGFLSKIPRGRTWKKHD